MRWLLSEDPLAQEILRRQVVVCMPVVNPDGYVLGNSYNTEGLNPCDHWTLDGPVDPDKCPEAAAVQRMLDEYQPEVHSDYHGLDMSFPGYIMQENSGGSYGNVSLRPYHYRITQLMDEAALEEGYPSDLQEQDAERQLWGPGLDAISHKLWTGRSRIFGGTYAYNRYHSLNLHSEVAWERSGFLRHRRLLQIGHEVWPGEYYPGYPTRVISQSAFHKVTAYGRTAVARRRSRVELWEKQRGILHGPINPQMEGVLFYVCATSPAAVERWLSDRSLKAFAVVIKDCPECNAQPILRLMEQHPEGAGQWGPEPYMLLNGGGPEGAARASKPACSPIEHGLSLRLRIPYPRARLKDLLMNGHDVARSETDGYVTWVDRGFTYVPINIPPEKSRKQESLAFPSLFIVTSEYDPGEKRTQGQW